MTAKPKKSSKSTTNSVGDEPVVVGVKGFDRDWKCRSYQYAVGETYTHDGEVRVCEAGFHAIEGNPIEVLKYYPPAQSRYAETKQFGAICRASDDGKVASAHITIGVELTVHDLVERAVKWTFARCKPADSKNVEGDQSAASSTGYQSAASSTGDQSAASSTGDWSAAMSSGRDGRVMGVRGCALFLVHRDPNTNEITHAWAGIVGRDGIEPNVWYTLNARGKPEQVAP